MTKPKLTDAVKQPSEKLPQTAPTPAQQTGAGSEQNAAPAKSATESESDDEPEPAAKTETVPAASSAPTLSQYTEAFGETQGCVFFAKGVSFSDACVAHIKTQAETIKAQGEEITALKSQVKTFAEKLAGEKEPVELKQDGAAASAADPIGSFAQAATARMNKKE